MAPRYTRSVGALAALDEPRPRDYLLDVQRLDAGADDEVIDRASPAPTVARLLALDADYRRQAQVGALVTVEGARGWLPVWELDGDGLRFTVSYSDTARAHELWHERDWVVIRWTGEGREGHATVVTEFRGALRGARVVRGREDECRAHYGIDW